MSLKPRKINILRRVRTRGREARNQSSFVRPGPDRPDRDQNETDQFNDPSFCRRKTTAQAERCPT